MASHVLSFKNQEEFFDKIKNRDRDLVVKMAKTLLHAIKHRKLKVDVFEVIFTDPRNASDLKELVFTKERADYLATLEMVMPDLIKHEEYEMCAEIKELLDKKSTTKKKIDKKEN